MRVLIDPNTYEPRNAHLEFWRSQQHTVMLSGPYQTGKTYTALSKINYLAATTPHARILLCRQTLRSLRDSVIPSWENKIIAGAFADEDTRGKIRRYGGNRPYEYAYPNGTKIILGGLDKPDKVLSAEYDYIYVPQAEEITLDAWDALKSRATGRAGATTNPQVMGDCNPGPPNHWIKHNESLQLLETTHKDNPTLWTGSEWTELGKRSIEILKSLTGARYKRGYLGQWVGSEGLVYEEDFDADKHVLRRDIDPNWSFFVSCDFGHRAPSVYQLWGVDKKKRMFLCKESYMTQRTTSYFIPIIKRWNLQHKIGLIVSEHDPETQAQLKKSGIPVRNAKKSIVSGINKVKDKFAVDGLFFLEDALDTLDTSLHPLPHSTVDEFTAYAYPDKDKMITDHPVDANNHGMDALRYAVEFVDKL